MVPVLGLAKIGGIVQLFHEAPEKFQLFHGVRHPLFPFTGVFTSFLSVGIWYRCTSQHIVQQFAWRPRMSGMRAWVSWVRVFCRS